MKIEILIGSFLVGIGVMWLITQWKIRRWYISECGLDGPDSIAAKAEMQWKGPIIVAGTVWFCLLLLDYFTHEQAMLYRWAPWVTRPKQFAYSLWGGLAVGIMLGVYLGYRRGMCLSRKSLTAFLPLVKS